MLSAFWQLLNLLSFSFLHANPQYLLFSVEVRRNTTQTHIFYKGRFLGTMNPNEKAFAIQPSCCVATWTYSNRNVVYKCNVHISMMSEATIDFYDSARRENLSGWSLLLFFFTKNFQEIGKVIKNMGKALNLLVEWEKILPQV